jgi:capsular polysaccharide biosynthesis protein
MEIFEDEKASSMEFLKMLYRKRKAIFITVILAVVITGVATFFIAPKYYSFGIIFPTSSYASGGVIENPQFGHDVDADQLMQILESEMLRDTIIQMYDLEKYYEVDKSDLDWKQKLDLKYIKDVIFLKTKYMSIVVSATTKDPKLSANIVNSIIDVVDVLRRKIFRGNQERALEALQTEYAEQQRTVADLKDRIYALKDTNDSKNILHNYLSALGKDMVEMDFSFVDSPEMELLLTNYKHEHALMMQLKTGSQTAEMALRMPLPKIYKIDKASPSFKKASPSYSVNLTIAFFGSILLSIIVIMIADRVRQVRQAVRQS